MFDTWRDWFAWRPVMTVNGYRVWLRRVWRGRFSKGWLYYDA